MHTRLLLIISVLALLSCQGRQVVETSAAQSKKDSVMIEQVTQVDDDSIIQDQMGINEANGKWSIEYRDSVEKEFQLMTSFFPQFKNHFIREKKAWEAYQKAVREVAGYGNHGSSTSMYVIDIVNQGIKLWETSFHNLYLHAWEKDEKHSNTIFSSSMIDEGYDSFISAANLFNEFEQKDLEAFRKSLRKEQKLWKEWMTIRNAISKELSSDVREVYDNCTNLTIRTKLLQLKNQNKALGVTGQEIQNCVLPDNCSDKALLEYPGFDKIWKKHLEDLDWYPIFE